MPNDKALEVLKVRMWELGHSFEEINKMNLYEFGLVISYWHEKGRVEAKRNRIRNRKGK